MRKSFQNEMVGFIQREKLMGASHHHGPYCHKCGGTKIKMTSSQQMLKVDGVKVLHAEATCQNKRCNNSWWSRHPSLLEKARQMDKSRKKNVVN